MKSISTPGKLCLPLLIATSLSIGIAFAQTEQSSPRSIGNGSNNWITLEGVQRDGGTLTFKEVTIETNGWLIIHPFEDGAPNGDKVVAASYLPAGSNRDVSIDVYKGLDSGERMIVMLHHDSNDNGVLDFLFVDAVNVMDRAVFEGNTMIGHVLAAP